MSAPPNQNTTEHNDEFESTRSQPPSPTAAASPFSRGEPAALARIPEQQPIMRSVAISSVPHQQRTLHFEPALRRVDPGDRGVLLRGESAHGLSSVLSSASTTPKRQLLASFRSRSDTSLVQKWHVDHAALAPRPAGFPPLRTSRVVFATPGPVVANRIADCLRVRSVKARFSKGPDEHVARCQNTGFAKFTVHLYAGEGGGVLVEVQRLSGDAVGFMRDCRALLRAAEGEAQGETAKAKEEPLYLRLPVGEMEFLKTATLPPASQKEEAESVGVTADLLASQRSDTNRLGMESLVVQTDPRKTLRSTAVLTSRLILCPNDPGNANFSLHNHVMSLLIYGDADDAHAACYPDDSALSDHYATLRILGLSALSNALALLAAEDALPAALAARFEWYASVLIVRLLRDLGAAESRPLAACYAARCLAALAAGSAELAAEVRKAGGHDAATYAEGVGAREFALLARDAGSCRNTLRCCV